MFTLPPVQCSICIITVFKEEVVLRAEPRACSHLGGEVPVEDALAVQVLQSSSDVQSQAEPDAPRQIHVAAQQLLQVAAVDVLHHHKRKRI